MNSSDQVTADMAAVGAWQKLAAIRAEPGNLSAVIGAAGAGCVCHGCGLGEPGLVSNDGIVATGVGGMAHERGEALMTDVIDRLVVAMNAHDLDAAAGFFHEDYRSEQPAHPGRVFAGRAQMRANWEAMFAGVPDFHAEIRRSVRDGDTTWTEWRWSGTRSDGQAFAMRGVTLFEITGGQIVAGRLYMEEVERDVVGIEQTVEALSGQRPRPAQQ